MLLRNCNGYVAALSLLLAWIGCVDSTVVERSAGEKLRIRCSEPDSILHGYYRKNLRNLRMRAHCNEGYSLLGSRVVPCINGKWAGERPICVKKGCGFTAQNPPNGRVLVESQFKLALFCSDNYILAGNRFTYCNGTHWDRPLGTCRKIPNRVSHECDFETQDICGWVVDQTDSFEWKRVAAMNVFTSFRTGPRHDHTTMSTSGGHYMLMESIGNVTAAVTLSSPIYDRELSLKTACCFRFYYFMYGSGVGDLYVLVKPASVTLAQTLDETNKYIKFNKTGNQNNLWNEAHFSIDEMDEDFQVIFVASGAKSHLSDIAIDDVKLMTGSECKILRKLDEDSDESSELEATTEETIFDTQSCVSRCGQTGTGILRQDGTLFGLCSCNFECILENDCCPDFVTVCLDDFFAASTWWAENVSASPDQQPTIAWEGTTDAKENKTTTTTKVTTTTTRIPIKSTNTTSTTTTTTRKPFKTTNTTSTTTTTTRKPFKTTNTTSTTTTTTGKPFKTTNTASTTTTTTRKSTITNTTTTTTTTRKPITTTTTTRKPSTTTITTKRRLAPTTTTTTTTTSTTTRQPTTKTTRTTPVTTKTTTTTTTPKATTQKSEVIANPTKLVPTDAPTRPVIDKGQSNATNRTFTWQNKSPSDDAQQRGSHEANILLIIFGAICVSIAVATVYVRRRKTVAAWMGKHFKNGNDGSAVEDSTSIIANFSPNATATNGTSATTSQMMFSKPNSKKPKRPVSGNESLTSSNDECYGNSDEIPLV